MNDTSLRDANGAVHERAVANPRIVSLVPSITELLFALDLGEHIVGRTTFCVHPAPSLASIPRIGGTKSLRMERLQALAPTHAIVNVDENRIEDVDAMREFIPHIIVTHPLAPEDNLGLYELLGGIFDRATQAETLAVRLAGELALNRELQDTLPARNVLYMIWKEPWMTVSRSTYISQMLASVNWHTLGHDPQVRYPETALNSNEARSADIVLLSSEPFPFKSKHIELVHSVLPDADVRLIDGELVSWYGSRAIEGLGYLRRFAKEDMREVRAAEMHVEANHASLPDLPDTPDSPGSTAASPADPLAGSTA